MLRYLRLFRYWPVAAEAKFTSFNFYSTQIPPTDHTNAEGAFEDIFDGETRTRLAVLKLELTIMQQSGRMVCDPANVTIKQWQYILTLSSVSARKLYYKHLYISEIKRPETEANGEAKKEENRLRKEEVQADRMQNRHIVYGLGHTALLLRLRKESMDKARNWRLLQAKEHGAQKIVFDCAYDSLMPTHVARYAARAIRECYRTNQMNSHPFDMHICARGLEGTTMSQLQKLVPKLFTPSFPIDIHTESAIDLFPRERLLYVSSYANRDLDEYNENDIYVIGGAHEKCINMPASVSRAKELGIRAARLPIDRYVQWGLGKKQLHSDVIFKILLDYKITRDWKYAFRHIPYGCLKK